MPLYLRRQGQTVQEKGFPQESHYTLQCKINLAVYSPTESDNDGCFPGYVPCDAAMCGRPGECACEVRLRPWRWDLWRGSGCEELR